MQKFRFNRRQYWFVVAVLLALKIGVLLAVAFDLELPSVLRSVDPAVMATLALAVAGRFVDAGWSGWVGGGLVLLIMLVVPFFVFLLSPMPQSANTLDAVPPMMGLNTIALLVLLVVAGARRSVPAPHQSPPDAEPGLR